MAKTPAGARTDSDSRPGDSPDNATARTDPTKVQGPDTPAAADTSTPRTQDEATLNPPLITKPAEQSDEGKDQTADPLLDTLKAKQDGDETVAPGTDRNGAEKINVITGGQYMYQDPYTLEVVDPGDEPQPITKTTAVETALIEGRLIEAV